MSFDNIGGEFWYDSILACPDCESNVEIRDLSICCKKCGYESGQGKDFRPHKPRSYVLEFSNLLMVDLKSVLESLDTGRPKVNYRGPIAPRDSSELMTVLSAHLRNGDAVLDLGCGSRDQYGPLNYLGYSYVGIDHSSPAADFLADAHALPFKPESFHCVFSYAVLEHLHNPFIAIKEIERVLKPGGYFVGTVSQGEPFHDSFFHHTPWGLISIVASTAKLELIRLWDSGDTLGSLSRMGRYSKLLKMTLAIISAVNDKLPWLTPRKMRWPQKAKELDKLYRAGSLCYVVRKRG
jgi:SAM-dependent methyltransferase